MRLVTGIDGLAKGYVASNHGYPTGDAPPNEALRQWQEYAATTADLDVSAIVGRACVSNLTEQTLRGYDAPYPDDTYKAALKSFRAIRVRDETRPRPRCGRRGRYWPGRPCRFSTVYGQQDPIGGARMPCSRARPGPAASRMCGWPRPEQLARRRRQSVGHWVADFVKTTFS